MKGDEHRTSISNHHLLKPNLAIYSSYIGSLVATHYTAHKCGSLESAVDSPQLPERRRTKCNKTPFLLLACTVGAIHVIYKSFN